MNQLRGAKGVFELQKNGQALVHKVRERREESRKKIKQQIDMLRKESASSKEKVFISITMPTTVTAHFFFVYDRLKVMTAVS